MNVLEVTYADRAGKLQEGSPDKTKLDTLPVALNVADVKALTTAQCNSLRCGDIVTKEDATGKHAYIVSYKKDGTGMCLTYADGSGYIETVSYDLTGDEWAYNSTDVFKGEECAKIYKVDKPIIRLTSDEINEFFNGGYDLLLANDKEDETVVATYSYDIDEEQLCISYLSHGHIIVERFDNNDEVFTYNEDDSRDYPLSQFALKTQVGTKLYQHFVTLTFSGQVDGHDLSPTGKTIEFNIVSTRASQYTSNDLYAITSRHIGEYNDGDTIITRETRSSLSVPDIMSSFTYIIRDIHSSGNFRLFINSNYMLAFPPYPTATFLYIQTSTRDTIDLTTGNITGGNNIPNTLAVSDVTDTVTEL